MGKSSAPPAPDYTAAAEQTAAGNRVNQYTPYGSLTYSAPTSGNKTDPWNQTINLSDTGKQLLDQQNQTSLGLGSLQNQGLGAVQNLFGNLPSASQLPAQQINPGQTAQDAIMQRQMPILNQQHDRLDNQLANQGIAMGSDAYKTAQDQFGRQMNDATSQAALQGIDVGNQARNQGMNEQGFYSQMPINLLNAIRSGSQVNNPTFGSTPQGANYLGAAQAQYGSALDASNASNAASGGFTSGLMGLGGMALMGPLGGKVAGLFSDRRLKSNIVRVGTHPLGIGIYEYDIFGERQRGVMADEVRAVKPEAVHVHPSGYDTVDYEAL